MYCAGHGGTSGSGASTSGTAGGRSNTTSSSVSPAHVSYQGSRRSANRGHGTYRGRGGSSRFPTVWGAPTIQYVQLGIGCLLSLLMIMIFKDIQRFSTFSTELVIRGFSVVVRYSAQLLLQIDTSWSAAEYSSILVFAVKFENEVIKFVAVTIIM